MSIILPEVIISNTLNGIVKIIRDDLVNNSSDDTETILYKILGKTEDNIDFKIDGYNFFKQAKKIFQNPQNLTVNFGYNLEVAKIISLHILMPSEQPYAQSIGVDESQYTETDDVNEIPKIKCAQFFDSSYQIMITSDNSIEVIVVYNILKSMLLICTPVLDIIGLKLLKISGGDIIFQDNFIPASIFHKVLNMSFIYELYVENFLEIGGIVNKIFFKNNK